MTLRTKRKLTDRNKTYTEFLQCMLEGLLRYGVIDPEGKSAEEIQEEIIDYMDEATSDSDFKVYAKVGHFPSVIQNARAFAHKGEYEMSCVFYAVWLEHWLNHMIQMAGLKRSLTDSEILEILRHSNFEAKATWILRLLGLRPIAKMHLQRMRKVAESRNAFVHYKWKSVDMDLDNSDKHQQDLKTVVENIEGTVKYLRRLENQQIFGGKKRAILARFKFNDTEDTENLLASRSRPNLRN